MTNYKKRIREALEAGEAEDLLFADARTKDLRALLADMDEMREALRHADRALKNWIELLPDCKDALDTIAIEAIEASLKEET